MSKITFGNATQSEAVIPFSELWKKKSIRPYEGKAKKNPIDDLILFEQQDSDKLDDPLQTKPKVKSGRA